MLTDHDVATGLHSNNSSRNQIIMGFSGTFAKIYHTLLRSLVQSVDKPLNIHIKKLGNGGCLDVIKHFLALPLGRKVGSLATYDILLRENQTQLLSAFLRPLNNERKRQLIKGDAVEQRHATQSLGFEDGSRDRPTRRITTLTGNGRPSLLYQSCQVELG